MKRFKRPLFVLTIILIGAITIESNFYGYLKWSIQKHFLATESPIRQTPKQVLDRLAVYEPSDVSLKLLAVGDLDDCRTGSYLPDRFQTLAHLLHLQPNPTTTDQHPSQASVLKTLHPNTPILALGDIAYRKGKPADFKDCFAARWGDLVPNMLPTSGNHEYLSFGAFGYYDFWRQQAGPNGLGYYSIEKDGWLFVSLNSEIPAGPETPQGKWLAQTLNASPDTCVLAYYHRPAYSLRDRDDAQHAQDLFAQLQHAGASLVLNGHNHFYEQTHPLNDVGQVDQETGLTSFIVGTGGAELNKPRALGPITAHADFNTFGYLELDLTATSYDWRFVDSTTGTVLDAGHHTCSTRV